MQFKERTLNALVGIINGETENPEDWYFDGGIEKHRTYMPYKSGPDLVRFFNELGSDDFYGSGFGSRASYTDSKLRELKNLQEFSNLVHELFHPRNNLDDQRDYQAAVDYLNQYLKFEHIEIYGVPGRFGTGYHAKSLQGVYVDFPHVESPHPLTHEFIQQQAEKCQRKINEADYSGAITNARGLIEEVLKAVQHKLDPTPKDTGGDLMKLYKEVQRLLNLDPAAQPVEPLKQLLAGLTSIVNGLSALRNHSGDAHAIRFRPSAHHAQLAVNTAKTLCDFLFSTFEYQQKMGKIKLVGERGYAQTS